MGTWQGAGESLVKVVMRVNQTRQDDMILQVEHLVGFLGKLGLRPDLFYDAIPAENCRVFQFTVVFVHSDNDRSVFYQ